MVRMLNRRAANWLPARGRSFPLTPQVEMMKRAPYFSLLLVCAVLGGSLVGVSAQADKPAVQTGKTTAANQAAAPADKTATAAIDPAALARTRKQVKVLDGIYKNAIVLVTTHFVKEDSDMPAGTAFKKLFEVANENGWHHVRLVDATGDPYDAVNVAQSDFEKSAVAQLVAGKDYVDQAIVRDGKPILQAATAIPVVMEKCIMCHDNYADVPAGKAIGALTYEIPIE